MVKTVSGMAWLVHWCVIYGCSSTGVCISLSPYHHDTLYSRRDTCYCRHAVRTFGPGCMQCWYMRGLVLVFTNLVQWHINFVIFCESWHIMRGGLKESITLAQWKSACQDNIDSDMHLNDILIKWICLSTALLHHGGWYLIVTLWRWLTALCMHL